MFQRHALAMAQFLSTPSARRATPSRRTPGRTRSISIHALREEGDRVHLPKADSSQNFYPRPPRGGRPQSSCAASAHGHISIHALREEGDHGVEGGQHLVGISIHALREEGDVAAPASAEGEQISIHALREEGDAESRFIPSFFFYFYPRPPRGGRPDYTGKSVQDVQFLSTPSARRATQVKCVRLLQWQISIHALREEGDLLPQDAD